MKYWSFRFASFDRLVFRIVDRLDPIDKLLLLGGQTSRDNVSTGSTGALWAYLFLRVLEYAEA